MIYEFVRNARKLRSGDRVIYVKEIHKEVIQSGKCYMRRGCKSVFSNARRKVMTKFAYKSSKGAI